MGLPEKITHESALAAKGDTCDVESWLKEAPKAAKQHLRNGIVSGELSRWRNPGTPNHLSDISEVEQLVGVIKKARSELCAKCPQADCPTEKLMKVLHEAPLKRGAEIVLSVYFNSI